MQNVDAKTSGREIMSNIIKGFNHLIYAEKLNRSPKTKYVPENIEKKVFRDAIWLRQNRMDVVNEMIQRGCFPGSEFYQFFSVIDEYDDSEMLDITFSFNKEEYVTRFLVKKVILDPEYTMVDKEKGEFRLKSIVLGDILYGPIRLYEAPEFANTKKTSVDWQFDTSEDFNIFKEEFIDKYGYKVLADHLPNGGGFLLAHRRLHYTRTSCYSYNGHYFEIDPNQDIEDRVPNGIESKLNSRGERIYHIGEDMWISQDSVNKLLPEAVILHPERWRNDRPRFYWNPDAVDYDCELSTEGGKHYLTICVTAKAMPDTADLTVSGTRISLFDENGIFAPKQYVGKIVYVRKYKIEQETWDNSQECTSVKAQMVGEMWPANHYISYDELMKNMAQQMNEIGHNLVSVKLTDRNRFHQIGDLYTLAQDYQAKKIDKFPSAFWYRATIENQRNGEKNYCDFDVAGDGPRIIDCGCYGIKYLPASKPIKDKHYDSLIEEAKECSPAEEVKVNKPNLSSSADDANWWLLSHFQYLENLEDNIGEDRTFVIPAEKMAGVNTQAVISSLGSLTYKYDVISENNDGSISVHVALDLCNDDIDALDCEDPVGGEEKNLG